MPSNDLPPISLHASIEYDLLVEATDPPGPYVAPKPVKSVPPAVRKLQAQLAETLRVMGGAA